MEYDREMDGWEGDEIGVDWEGVDDGERKEDGEGNESGEKEWGRGVGEENKEEEDEDEWGVNEVWGNGWV